MTGGTISPDELLAALHLQRAGRRRVFVVIAGAALLGGMALLATGHRAPGIVCTAVSIGMLLSEFANARVLLPWRAKRLCGEGSTFRQPGELDWTGKHLVSRTPRGEARTPWRELRPLVENDAVFLVRHRSGRVQVVPKSWFDDAAMASFRTAFARAGR
jgi:hypothetical protein